MRRLRDLFVGSGLGARLMRASSWMILGFGMSQVLRLASNLLLTRLLFPEAFGLLALITVILVGLTMFSDVGLSPSIQQNKRGDDPDFLDTAWTIQVVRGVVLWLVCCALAWPIANFYGQPLLVSMLPIAGISLLVNGFNPTRIETAGRHLLVGRVTVLNLVSQVMGLVVTLVLAWYLRSVWALVYGAVISPTIHLVMYHLFLPGAPNRFRWEKDAGDQLLSFGKWIFLSTLCGFLLSQGDRAILGKYLSMEMLGIYSIGYFLASFPLSLAAGVSSRVLIPLYRDVPPGASEANFSKVRQVRFLFSVGTFAAQYTLAFVGVWLVGLLYDPRFAMAGVITVAVAIMHIPFLIGMTYDQMALAAGESRIFFLVLLGRTILQIGLFLIGLELDGLRGGLIGVGLAGMLSHSMVVWLARRYGAWDPLHDAIWAGLGALVVAVAIWFHGDTLGLLRDFNLD